MVLTVCYPMRRRSQAYQPFIAHTTLASEVYLFQWAYRVILVDEEGRGFTAIRTYTSLRVCYDVAALTTTPIDSPLDEMYRETDVKARISTSCLGKKNFFSGKSTYKAEALAG